MKTKLIPALLYLASCALIRGASLSVSWSTVDGGGGTSTSADGRFSVSSTAGQPDAGLLKGGGFDLFGGFWYPKGDCGCLLTIERVGENIVVTWPATFAGCALQTTGELGASPGTTIWTPVAVSLTGGTYTYTAPIEGAARFFRLNGE